MANNVKKVRQSKKLTQAQLAALTNGVLSQGEICKIETGWYGRPTPKWRRVLSEALGVAETELFPDQKKA